MSYLLRENILLHSLYFLYNLLIKIHNQSFIIIENLENLFFETKTRLTVHKKLKAQAIVIQAIKY